MHFNPQFDLFDNFRDILLKMYNYSDPMITPTKDKQFGHFQANFALSLSKKIKKNPRDIANDVCKNIKNNSLWENLEVAGPGFINITLSKNYLEQVAKHLYSQPKAGLKPLPHEGLTIIDYPSPNVAKKMHVGHLRASIIGDCLFRIIKSLGQEVIGQNHIGDWGTQFGILIEYMTQNNLKPKTSIENLNLWYKEAQHLFENDESFQSKAKNRVFLLQSGDNESIKIWKIITGISCDYFQEIFSLLQLCCRKEDIRGESFYNNKLLPTVQDLEAKGLVEENDGAKVYFSKEHKDKDKNPIPCILQKSNGGFLYATTDLSAYRYRMETLKASRIIYITDARQKLHFSLIFEITQQAGWKNDCKAFHIPFGMVLGDDQKPFKTRSGETIDLLSLIEEGKKRALSMIKNRDLNEEEKITLALNLTIGALKYADLSQELTRNYIFSWDKMLSFQGKTAPYLQNAYVRILSLFRKAKQDFNEPIEGSFILDTEIEKLLVLQCCQFCNQIHSVLKSYTPHTICHYLYDLASLFHQFYEQCPILKETNLNIQKSRMKQCQMVGNTLKEGLYLLGIPILKKM